MQIRLQPLEHQQRALKALAHVFNGVEIDPSSPEEANVTFDPTDPQIAENIKALQSGMVSDLPSIPRDWRGRVDDGALGVDVKMETGTGKTLVYTQLMYELNHLYGFTKFIILVPSASIKEGTKAFIESDYAKRYFDDAYNKRLSLSLHTLDAQNRSKGRKMFPRAITSFAQSSRVIRGQISALLMTDGMLRSQKTMNFEYDQTVMGDANVPNEALRQTRPIVIIDEPHRFQRGNASYRTLLDKLRPQAIFRFGATFPKVDTRGKTDYNNLIYNLGAVEAFNDQLVKGVAIQYPRDADSDTTRLKLIDVRGTQQAVFQDIDAGKSLTFARNDTLAQAHTDFSGITVAAIGKTENPAISKGVTLSNGQVLAKGDTIAARVYSDTYQVLMMRQALENHFETEWENFHRASKVKTLTLFFIDSVASYRGEFGAGHLRVRFEELLTDKLKKEITARQDDASSVAQDYVAYLHASLADVQATNGGYFSADNSSSEEEIKAEVDQILRDKQALLSFKKPNDTPNTMRFIFSKWTLREGWDNPNVFQIVKLRSSGSEISKLQEVGRGLRLPVDTSGTRLDQEQFYLTYLIDYTEKSFAESLVSEINSDVSGGRASVKALLPKIAYEREMEENTLLAELLVAGFVDTEQNVVSEKESEFYQAYPEFNVDQLRPDKVVSDTKKTMVKIRPNRYAELKDLWEAVNAKYYLSLEDLTQEEIDTCIDSILDSDIHRLEVGRFDQITLARAEGVGLALRTETKKTFNATETIPYGEWLKLAYSQTYLPINRIHAGLVRHNAKKKLPASFFNKTTLGEFVAQFVEWMQAEFLGRFSYSRIDGVIAGTELTNADGEPKEHIVQGNIGVHREEIAKVPDKFLYDSFVYDSWKEHSTIQDSDLDEVVVYGKIPRRSIQVPLYFGGTTSPDFMYVLKTKDGELSLNFIVETKDYDRRSEMREEEQRKIAAAKKFFRDMDNDSFKVTFEPQVRRDDIAYMVHRLLSAEDG